MENQTSWAMQGRPGVEQAFNVQGPPPEFVLVRDIQALTVKEMFLYLLMKFTKMTLNGQSIY